MTPEDERQAFRFAMAIVLMRAKAAKLTITNAEMLAIEAAPHFRFTDDGVRFDLVPGRWNRFVRNNDQLFNMAVACVVNRQPEKNLRLTNEELGDLLRLDLDLEFVVLDDGAVEFSIKSAADAPAAGRA